MIDLLFIVVMICLFFIAAIAAIISDDIYSGKEDYINELEKKVKRK